MYTNTAVCKNHHIKVIQAGSPGLVTLKQLSSKLSFIINRIDTKKRQQTAAFYTRCVELAVKMLLVGDEASKVQSTDGKITWEGDVGGCRDVGKHDGVMPLSTCWPLVEQVFHYVADEVCSPILRYMNCFPA